MTGEDVLACRFPEDTIAVMATNMDIHNKDNPGGSFITIQNGYVIVWSSHIVACCHRESENLPVTGRALHFGRRISRLGSSNDCLLSGVRTGSRDGSDIVFKKTYQSSRCLCRGT